MNSAAGTLNGATTAGVRLLWALALVGCAADPSLHQAGRTEDDNSGFSSQENVATTVDARARADFETALRHLQAGAYDQGAELLRRVIERAPGHAAPHINLAIAYERMGNLAAAEDSVKQALAISPEDPVAHTEYGLIYRKTGRFAQARQMYERALQRHPGFLPARKNLGILCDVYLRDLECALASYRAYGASAPQDQNVGLWIADLEKRLGKQ